MGKPNLKPAEADPSTINEIVDHWIGLRAQRTLEIGAFTPVAELFLDFQAWHTAEYPDEPSPSDCAFSRALMTSFKIRIEKLKVRVFGEGAKVAVCANLMLREPIAARAA